MDVGLVKWGRKKHHRVKGASSPFARRVHDCECLDNRTRGRVSNFFISARSARPFLPMPILSRSALPSFACARPIMVAGALLFPLSALAQTPAVPPSAPAPFALSKPTAPTQTVSVLFIALDDATTQPADGPSLQGAPLMPNTAPPVADVPLTALPPSPTSWNGAPLRARWGVLLKKKARSNQPDPRFLPIPDPPSNATPDSVFGPNKTAKGNAPATTGTGAAMPATPPAPLAPTQNTSAPGRSLLAALSMRRALVGLGYVNAEAVSPDSNLVARALGDKRLVPGTLSTLRGALQDLAAAPNLEEAKRPDAIKNATQTASNAASALGQATGYRAVVAVYVGALNGGKAPFSLVLSDGARESGEPMLWEETAKDDASARESGALTGAALLDKSLRAWPTPLATASKTLADAHLARAKAAGAAGDLGTAQDEVTRVLSLDPTRSDALTLLGDLLAPTNVPGAIDAYRRATQINTQDGASYAKVAIALIDSPTPDFPSVLKAGQAALQRGTDTAPLRVAMARAQFGRADLFRRANRIDSAEDAEADAQTHLERALQLAPGDPQALKFLARALITSGRTAEGVQALDRVAPLYPNDIDLQFQYARALLTRPNRKEDAFVAYSRVWKALGPRSADLDDTSAQLLSQGFDQHVFALGKSGRQLSDGVAGGSIAREQAFLQLKRLKADMNDASDAIALLRPPSDTSGQASAARSFAASLMVQSLEAQQTFLDTGQDLYRTRANDLFRQAVAQLNAARTGTR